MKTLSNYPPLTLANIFTLKGEPVTKIVRTNNRSDTKPSGRKNALDFEEWVYYNMPDKTKECYRFKNGTLVGYKNDEF
jgi:hypothetical protein